MKTLQKSLAFAGKTFTGSEKDILALTQEVKHHAGRMVQAVNFAVAHALHHSQFNQLAPLKALITLADDENPQLKKLGIKLKAYISEVVPTVKAFAKKDEGHSVTYSVKEDERKLDAEVIQGFAAWEPEKAPQKPAAITEKSVTAILTKWSKREAYLKASNDGESLAAERLILMQGLESMLADLRSSVSTEQATGDAIGEAVAEQLIKGTETQAA